MKAIAYKFYFQSTKGGNPLTLYQWAESLPEQDKKAFTAADQRQILHRQRAIELGLMYKDLQGFYIWKDAESENQGKINDIEWVGYFNRYIQECNIDFKIERIETKNMLTIYSKNNCPYCVNAKNYLKHNDIDFIEINIEEDQTAREFILSQGLRTLPQIFLDKKLFVSGGWAGLSAMKPDQIRQALDQHNTQAQGTT